MIAERSETMDVGRGLAFSLLMQEDWKKEIEEAITKVKGDLPERKRQRHRRQKRGYWTPSGFAWFRRRKRNQQKRQAQSRYSKHDLVRYSRA